MPATVMLSWLQGSICSLYSLDLLLFTLCSRLSCAIYTRVESCARLIGCMPGLIGEMDTIPVVARYVSLEMERAKISCELSPWFK